MFNLRQTWNEIFPAPKLYALDVKVNMIDTNWPITAKVTPRVAPKPKVHFNPNFLKNPAEASKVLPIVPQAASGNEEALSAKVREIAVLKQQKLELQSMLNKKKNAVSVIRPHFLDY